MDLEKRFGRHLIRLEGDILHCKQTGAITLDELRAILTFWEEILTRNPRTYGLIDVSDGIHFGPAERKYTKEWSVRWQFAGVAFFGAGYVMRAILTMVNRATEIVRKGKTAPIFYCGTEQEARAWIEELRRRYEKASSSQDR